MDKKNKIEVSYIARMYARFKLSLMGVRTHEIEKSLQFGLLSESYQNLGVIAAVMANHKTVKSGSEYNYNFWEFKVPLELPDFLLCVCIEDFDGEYKTNGFFVFPKSVLKKFTSKKTLNIFESDISGNYKKEPTFNKHEYWNRGDLIL